MVSPNEAAKDRYMPKTEEAETTIGRRSLGSKRLRGVGLTSILSAHMPPRCVSLMLGLVSVCARETCSAYENATELSSFLLQQPCKEGAAGSGWPVQQPLSSDQAIKSPTIETPRPARHRS